MGVSDIPDIGRSIVAGGYRTNYHDMGEGDPVVLIHGAAAGVTSWANWRFTLPAIARTHRAIALDMLGFGYSDHARGQVYTKDIWVEHLKAFLDALGLEKVTLVGNSFGGAMTIAFAARYPDRVKDFVLMGAAGLDFELLPALANAWGYEPSLEAMRDMVRQFAYDPGLISDDIVEIRYRASIQPGVQEAFSAMFPEPRRQRIRDLSTPEDQIAALPHKALIIHGREDKFVPLSCGLRFNELIARSQLHIFGQCGHWAQIEHMARFHALVGQFINEEDRP